MFGRISRAFTLIELLIVVAIIAILAAIAVPNFLEAQTRSKVSRAKSDMRSVATAIEAYAVDNNSFPKCNLWGHAMWTQGRALNRPTFERLTSPIAYISSVHAFVDPFRPRTDLQYKVDWTGFDPFDARDVEVSKYYYYWARNNSAGTNSRWDQPNDTKPVAWFVHSGGPALFRWPMHSALNGQLATDTKMLWALYDPSNGTVSSGGLWRTGGASGREGDAAFQRHIMTQNK